MKKLFIFILFFLTLLANPYLLDARAGFGEEEQLQFGSDEAPPCPAENEIKKGFGVAPFASPGYTPETGFVLGGAVVFTYRAEDSTAEDRPSSLELLLMYSQKQQLGISITPDFYFDNEDWEAKMVLTYSDYPDVFYGIGNDTDEDKEDYKTERIGLQPWIIRKIYSNLKFGIMYELNGFDVSEEGVALVSLSPTGSDGGINSGSGPLLEWDTRDNIFCSSKGGWYRFYAGFYRDWLGSDFNYELYTLDLRHYVAMLSSHILAFQVYGRFSEGEVPFPWLSKLKLLRGIVGGRFRDRYAYASQVEYRYPIAWRFSGVAFAGVGDVSGSLGNFEIDEMKFAGGGGIRFAVNRQEKINIRLDIGASPWGICFYFHIAEVF
ncbi:MAG: BamA/TamA family outer membrane protein [Deltaproteobacteria bacterium]|nr:MAG: BamA/TamA family outer membrane protein [Deltaproteobacteria bacterium]